MDSHPPETSPASLIETIERGQERYERSTDFTIGIEEEYAICDERTLDLVDRFEDFEALAKQVGLGQAVAGELMASEIEFRTGACQDWEQARSELTGLRAQVADLAQGQGLAVGTSGTHPWADYREQRTIDTPYYRRLVERMQYTAHRNNTFGLHVHVGVHGADRAIAVADALRNYHPLLLALSASSPFLDGRDSGLASARAQTFSRNFPRGNIAPEFGTWRGFEEFVRFLHEVGSIESFGQMWWGIRPHALHGTVELRCFDGQPDVQDTLAIAALAVGLVAWLCERHDAGELERVHPESLVDENIWRATRWGTAAEMIDLGHGATTKPAAELIEQVVARARDAGSRAGLGIDEGLDRVLWRVEQGCSAHWQRNILRSSGELRDAYEQVVATTMSSAVVRPTG